MKLENEFVVPAGPDTVWALLNDVPRVVPCMPGAELLEVVDENRWKARLSVKMGPIALQFATDVTRDEVDDESRAVRLAVVARETKGRGAARATVRSSVDVGEQGTSVIVATDLQMQGAVAQYGRGIIADVAGQLTRQFAACLAEQLAPPTTATAAAPGNAPAPAPVVPVGGVRLALRALWRTLTRSFRRERHAG